MSAPAHAAPWLGCLVGSLCPMLQSTKGIVLRTVKYGESSVIVSIFTESFGLQSYLIPGVRVTTKKGSASANHFQPSSMLELVVYHNELKKLQRLREFKWGFLYQHLFFDVVKNSVALFMVELLIKCLKQPEQHLELFHFVEDSLISLDRAPSQVVANFPLFFALHLAGFLGWRIEGDYTDDRPFLDLAEGLFSDEPPRHTQFLSGMHSKATAQLLRITQVSDLAEIQLNQESRVLLMQAYQDFYALHMEDFTPMKTLAVLHAVLST